MPSFRPCERLRSRVAAIDVLTVAGGAIDVLPRAGAVLGIQIRGRVQSGDALLETIGVTGIQTTRRPYVYVGETVSILVRFTPEGAACLGIPSAELARRSVPLDALVPRARVRTLEANLQATTSDASRVAVVERFLLELPFTRDPLVERAVALLASCEDDGRIAHVARMLDVSERQLERRFLARVGLSPKRFAALRRFERALELATTAPSLTRVALDAGYYDQSHFIRDFKRFAGASPSALLESRVGDVGFVQSGGREAAHVHRER